MKKIKLHNGVVLPAIGYGTYPLRDELITALPIAYKYGYRMFDTSDDYHNMSHIGTVISSSSSFDDVFIVTKISWPFDPKKIEEMVTEYKGKLGLKNRPIDLLLLHFPYPYLYIKAWKEMEKLYQNGLCRAIGVCNFEIKHLNNLINHCRIVPMVNQIELHPMFQQKEVCEFCNQHEIAIMSYSPVARMNSKLLDNIELIKIADKYCKKPVQVILRWNYQHGYIPIPASSKEEHIKSNIDIFDFQLNTDEMEK